MKKTTLLRRAGPVILVMALSTHSYSNPRVPAQSSGHSTTQASETLEVNSVNLQPADSAASAPDSTPAPRRLPPKAPDSAAVGAKSPGQDFNVTTWKTKKTVAHAVQLMSPPHHATYTPGVITFQWKLTVATKKQKKFHFFIESRDGKTKINRKTKNEKRLMSIGPGQYKWRVVADTPKADSRWRSFKVIQMKSGEITRLYEGRSMRKPTSTGETQYPQATIIDKGDPNAEGAPDIKPLTAPTASRLKPPVIAQVAKVKTPAVPVAAATPATATKPPPLADRTAKTPSGRAPASVDGTTNNKAGINPGGELSAPAVKLLTPKPKSANDALNFD